MTAAPPSQPPATLIAPDETVERMHNCLLGLAAHAMAMAERLLQEAGVTTCFRPFAWLFAGRARRRGRRIRAAARTLQALADMLDPQAHQDDASQNPLPDDECPADAAMAPFSFASAWAYPPPESPALPPVLRPASPAARCRGAMRPRTLPPRPRLLPPQQASPRAPLRLPAA